MARLLRRQPGQSRLRPPTIVGAPTVFRPLQTTLAANNAIVYQRRTVVHSRLRAPTAVAAATVFRPLQVSIKSALQPPQFDTRRQTHPKLRLPTVIAPQVVSVGGSYRVIHRRRI